MKRRTRQSTKKNEGSLPYHFFPSLHGPWSMGCQQSPRNAPAYIQCYPPPLFFDCLCCAWSTFPFAYLFARVQFFISLDPLIHSLSLISSRVVSQRLDLP
ncbi:hypothetical protein K457DRAFT_183449 [Linnemannia elongata AG-77]|uniref:Uncharacterized protein n=1 Tax=Linnemannia elongata AG-77 TaxID=1314771 RepID=A0A197KB08_9FUNG|nr:hypothetical protein K457DRAFT_183449 [Linnemannia elongata AG-77]